MVGASRRQVLGSVMLEALALGLGRVDRRPRRGLRPGQGPQRDLRRDGPRPARGGHGVRARGTAIVALLVGTLVTLVGRAAAGAAGDAASPRSRAARRRSGGAQAAARRRASCAPRRRLLGRPASRVGGSAGRLARRNAMRNPGRTAAPPAALMIGVTLVTARHRVADGLRQDRPRARSSDRIARVARDHRRRTAGRRSTRAIARTAAARRASPRVSALRQDGGARVRRQGDRQRRSTRRRSRKVFDFDWKDGSTRVAHHARRRRRDRRRGLGEGARPRRRRRASRSPRPRARSCALTVRGIEDSPVLDSLGLGPITVSDAGVRHGVRERSATA